MKLPNCEHAVVPRAKVVDYLLSYTHRDGQHKAVFFKRFGFAAAEWERLAQALCEHDVARIETFSYGQRYIVEGILRSPGMRNPLIRTVWFVESGEDTPRFVTAYALRRDTDD